MCGIVGFVDKEKHKEETIKKMMMRINHRGPDGEGTFIDEDIALGHKRLSIIDLNTGNQPMFNENERYVIIFNGEIYNYLELKEELLKKDHYFKTTSDTEVLLHGYEEYGYNLLQRLRGMFAFVIWDREKKELFGARDNFGIKPFYYYQNENVFMFASEIKAFLDHPKFKKELNKEILPLYLSFNYSPTEDTFFKGVKKLEPGHFLVYKNGKLIIKRYFKLTFNEKEQPEAKAVEEIANIMKDSVKKHMLADVEVGSFLSSGIDSSYLVALARPDKTYTVGYKISKYNEISYAEDLAKKLNINNTSKIITKEEYFKVIPKIMYHMDEPLADPAAVALYFVSKLASKDVKVVLSGEGADEFFGGYNYYREEVDYKFYNKIPFFIRHAISSVCKLLPEVRGINFLVRRGQKLEDNYIGVNKVFSEKERKKIINFKDKE
ncbi:MAG TPA: asparagine synthase (glutamine-hydrolyzing), partial [Bacilli bacterium]|nr:asparagine synthase (glutamine-hydrolyzing) [Bacilli bacterium]